MKKTYLLLVLVLCIGLILAGCQNEKPAEQTKSPEESATAKPAETSDTEATEAIENFNSTGMPIVNEKLTLRFVTYKFPQHGDFKVLPIVQRLEEQTNIHIEWDSIPSDSFVEQKNLMLAGNDLPDAFCGAGPDDSDIARYGNQGVFIPLNELIENYAPNIKETMQEVPEISSVITAPDGNIYSLFSLEDLSFVQSPQALYVNNVWIENTVGAAPETTEDFKNMLLAFKDSDANGNGDTSDEIPFSFINNEFRRGLYTLYGSFGVADDPSYLMMDGEQVLFTRTMEGFKEGTQYFHELYAAGLMDPEGFTQDYSQYVAKGTNEEAAIYGSFLGWNGAEVGVDRFESEYGTLKPLKGPNGDQLWRRADKGIYRNRFTITSKNEYPEATIRWADQLFIPENGVEISYGTFGIVIDHKEDGTYVKLPPEEGQSTYEQRCSNGMWVAVPNIIRSVYFDNLDEGFNICLYNYEDVYLPYLVESKYPNIFFETEVMEKISSIKTDIDPYVQQMQAKWIVEGGIEDEWEDYIAQLEQMGLSELMAIYQDAYDNLMNK